MHVWTQASTRRSAASATRSAPRHSGTSRHSPPSHYEAAFAHYEHAARLAPTSVDARYNAARVQYTLGSAFYRPPEAHAALARALELYAAALALAAPDQDGVPDAARLDVLSNMAYALQALAEIQDTFECDDEGVHRRAALAMDALGIAPGTSVLALYLAAMRALEETERGQHAVLAHALGDAPRAPSGAAADAPLYTSSLVAPASLLETFGDELACATALLGQASEETLPTTLLGAEQIAARADAYQASLPPGFGAQHSPDDEWDEQCDALQWARLAAHVAAVQRAGELAQLAGAAWPVEEADVARVAELEQAIEARAAELLAAPPPAQSLTSVRASGPEQRRHEHAVERLCDVADHAQSLAALFARAAPTAERAWALAALAARCLQAALAALEGAAPAAVGSTASLAVPGAPFAWIPLEEARPVAGTNTSTSVSRTRASIYASLAQLALLRTDPTLLAALPAAAEAHGKLLANARVYVRRALVDHGLGWVTHVRPNASHEPTIYGRALGHSPPDGWEALVQDAELLLTGVRVLWLRAAYEGVHGMDASATRTELAAWAGAIWSLRRGNPGVWSAALDPHASLTRLGLDTPRLTPAEHPFWEGWIALQTAPCAPADIP